MKNRNPTTWEIRYIILGLDFVDTSTTVRAGMRATRCALARVRNSTQDSLNARHSAIFQDVASGWKCLQSYWKPMFLCRRTVKMIVFHLLCLVFASAFHGFAIAIVGRRSHIYPQQISLDSN